MIPVAAYCRVSTDSADQLNSFDSQVRYFREYIRRQPGWTLCDIYADEGITGTSTGKRAAFNRMIADARRGRFRLILTKEVSRFSRNILDTIAYTRELKGLGVGVVFMNDGIDTRDADAELRLSIMGSIAQEESRKTSQRVRWGQTRQMEKGVVFGRSMLGYDVKDGVLAINPEGAKIVRLIFQKYGVEQKGTSTIARELREAGIRTYTGNPVWRESQILKILKNEKYAGDLVQKKTITPDYLSHAKQRNRGQEALISIQNHHEPIIGREQWETVQRRIHQSDRRAGEPSGHSSRYLFSGRIKCGLCGQSFVSRKKRLKNGSEYRRWCCYSAAVHGRQRLDPQGNTVGCDIGRQLRDELACEMLRQVIASLPLDREALVKSVACAALEAIGEDAGPLRRAHPEQALELLREKKERMLDAYLSGDITREEMQRLRCRYDRQIEEQTRLLKKIPSAAAPSGDIRERIHSLLSGAASGAVLSQAVGRALLEQMTVCPEGLVTVKLCCLPARFDFALVPAGDP